MADQFQYVHLPDGSYGKFPGDAGDDVIRGQILKDFPSVAVADRPGVQRPSAPAMQADRPPVSPLDVASGIVSPMARMTKVGAQSTAYGLTRGHSYPLGKPNMDQFKSDAEGVGLGMATGLLEDAPVRFAPRLDEGAAPSVNTASSPVNRSAVGAAGGATRSATGSVLDVTSHIPGKIGMASKLLRKFGVGGGNGSGAGAAEEAAAPRMVNGSTAPMPHDRAGMGIHGSPVSEWGKTIDTPPTRPPAARSVPAWQKLQRPASVNPNGDARTAPNLDIDLQAQRQAGIERDSGKLPAGTSYVQRSQQIKDGLIKGAGMNGAKPATQVATPAQVTPKAAAGDTLVRAQAEDTRLENAGGQFGKPVAVGKLQKSNVYKHKPGAGPGVGLSKLEQKQSQMRLRNRLKKTGEE